MVDPGALADKLEEIAKSKDKIGWHQLSSGSYLTGQAERKADERKREAKRKAYKTIFDETLIGTAGDGKHRRFQMMQKLKHHDSNARKA